MNLHNAEFIKSAVGPADFIRDGLPQIIFSGKSNVGKSSVINKILNRKNFARVGGTPGKTVHINYFVIDNAAYFVDLPGYGYAKVSKAERSRWSRLMEDYFDEPDLITLGVLIVDIRHRPTVDDCTMASWFKATACPLMVVANKMDKIKKSELDKHLKVIRDTLNLDEGAVILPFSAAKGTNREQLIAEIEKSI